MAVLVFLLGKAVNRMLADERKKSRSPFKEKLHRPAGESLRLKVDELSDQMLESGFQLLICLIAPCIFLMILPVGKHLSLLIVSITLFVGCWGFAWSKWKSVRALRVELRDTRLGFDGERYVAAELNQLQSEGYRVFHDFIVDWVPDDQIHNIDHIVVGPTGVFAIETKAWRKPLGREGDENHKLIVEGNTIQKPGDIPRSDAIEQAKRNGATLSKWLTGSAPKEVPVRPLVVVPGWYVKSDGWETKGVQPLSELANRFHQLQRYAALSPQQIQQLGDKIESHCQNVEGAR